MKELEKYTKSEIEEISIRDLIKAQFVHDAEDDRAVIYCHEYEYFDKLLAICAKKGLDEYAEILIQKKGDESRWPDETFKHYYVLGKDGYRYHYDCFKKCAKLACAIEDSRVDKSQKDKIIKEVVSIFSSRDFEKTRFLYLQLEAFLDYAVKQEDPAMLEKLLMGGRQAQQDLYPAHFPTIRLYRYVDKLVELDAKQGLEIAFLIHKERATAEKYGVLFRLDKYVPYLYQKEDYSKLFKKYKEKCSQSEA